MGTSPGETRAEVVAAGHERHSRPALTDYRAAADRPLPGQPELFILFCKGVPYLKIKYLKYVRCYLTAPMRRRLFYNNMIMTMLSNSI